MKIMDNRFGSELVTQKGKTFKFDSIECLAAYYLKDNAVRDQIHSLWVTPFDQPEALMEATKAVYLHSETLRSPMGLNLSAYESEAAAQKFREEYRGEIITLEEVYRLVEGAWGK